MKPKYNCEVSYKLTCPYHLTVVRRALTIKMDLASLISYFALLFLDTVVVESSAQIFSLLSCWQSSTIRVSFLDNKLYSKDIN